VIQISEFVRLESPQRDSSLNFANVVLGSNMLSESAFY